MLKKTDYVPINYRTLNLLDDNIQRLVSDTIWRGEIKNNKQDIPKKNLSKLMSESYE